MKSNAIITASLQTSNKQILTIYSKLQIKNNNSNDKELVVKL